MHPEGEYSSDLITMIYLMNHMPDVRDEAKYEQLGAYLVRKYAGAELARYLVAVNWALEEGNLDFEEYSPYVRQPTDHIVVYLDKVRRLLEKLTTG